MEDESLNRANIYSGLSTPEVSPQKPVSEQPGTLMHDKLWENLDQALQDHEMLL